MTEDAVGDHGEEVAPIIDAELARPLDGDLDGGDVGARRDGELVLGIGPPEPEEGGHSPGRIPGADPGEAGNVAPPPFPVPARVVPAPAGEGRRREDALRGGAAGEGEAHAGRPGGEGRAPRIHADAEGPADADEGRWFPGRGGGGLEGSREQVPEEFRRGRAAAGPVGGGGAGVPRGVGGGGSHHPPRRPRRRPGPPPRPRGLSGGEVRISPGDPVERASTSPAAAAARDGSPKRSRSLAMPALPHPADAPTLARGRGHARGCTARP